MLNNERTSETIELQTFSITETPIIAASFSQIISDTAINVPLNSQISGLQGQFTFEITPITLLYASPLTVEVAKLIPPIRSVDLTHYIFEHPNELRNVIAEQNAAERAEQLLTSQFLSSELLAGLRSSATRAPFSFDNDFLNRQGQGARQHPWHPEWHREQEAQQQRELERQQELQRQQQQQQQQANQMNDNPRRVRRCRTIAKPSRAS